MPPNRCRQATASGGITRRFFWVDQLVAQPLMRTLCMIMTDKFADTMAQMLLAQRDYPAEAFLFDRSDKSLAVGTGAAAFDSRAG